MSSFRWKLWHCVSNSTLLDTTPHMSQLINSSGQELKASSAWQPGKESWSLNMLSSRLHPITFPFGGFSAQTSVESSESSYTEVLNLVVALERPNTYIYLRFLLIPYDFAFCMQVFVLKVSFSIWRNVGNLNFSWSLSLNLSIVK